MNVFGNGHRQPNSCSMGRREEKLQTLTLIPLLGGLGPGALIELFQLPGSWVHPISGRTLHRLSGTKLALQDRHDHGGRKRAPNHSVEKIARFSLHRPPKKCNLAKCGATLKDSESVSTGVWCVLGFSPGGGNRPQTLKLQKGKNAEKGHFYFLQQTLVCTNAGSSASPKPHPSNLRVPNGVFQTVFFRFLVSACDRGKPSSEGQGMPENTSF